MANTYLTRTFGSVPSITKFTWSGWVKRSKLGTQQAMISGYQNSNTGQLFYFTGDDKLAYYAQAGGVVKCNVITNAVFKDTSAWYHIMLVVDSTQSNAANRVKFYVNNVLKSYATTVAHALNWEAYFMMTVPTNVGRNGMNTSNYFEGVMSHMHMTHGYLYTPSTFGETDSTTGEWKIKTSPTVNYNSNGFFILKDANTGTDYSGNSENFSSGGGTLTATKDCPSNVLATLNPLFYASSTYTLLNGNLKTNGSSSNADRSLYGTIGASSGKYYFETKIDNTNGGDSNNIRIGIVSDDQVVQTANNGTFFSTSRGYAYYGQDGSKRNSGNTASYGNTFTTNDIIGCAFDLDNNKIYWSKNGTFQNSGNPTSGSTGTGSAYNLATGYSYLPAISSYYTNDKVSINFGNGFFGTTAITTNSGNGYAGAEGASKFNYAVPSGYTALSTKGLNT